MPNWVSILLVVAITGFIGTVLFPPAVPIFIGIQAALAGILVITSIPTIQELYTETLAFLTAINLYQFAQKPEDLAIPDTTLIEKDISTLMRYAFAFVVVVLL